MLQANYWHEQVRYMRSLATPRSFPSFHLSLLSLSLSRLVLIARFCTSASPSLSGIMHVYTCGWHQCTQSLALRVAETCCCCCCWWRYDDKAMRAVAANDRSPMVSSAVVTICLRGRICVTRTLRGDVFIRDALINTVRAWAWNGEWMNASTANNVVYTDGARRVGVPLRIYHHQHKQ